MRLSNLIIKGTLSGRRPALREEMLIVGARSSGNRRGHVVLHAAEALARRHGRQAARHHAGLVKLSGANSVLIHRNTTLAELVTRHGGESAPDTGIIVEAVDIRETVAASEQRIEAPAIITIADSATEEAMIMETDEANAIDAETPPRPEEIPRAAGEPTNVAKSKPESKTGAPAKERYIRRRPDRIVAPAAIDADRSGPPGPIAAIGEPAAVVVGRPAPRFVRYPSPTIIGFPLP